METFGQNLRRIRRERGLTQSQLGELVGMSGSAVGQFESSGKTPQLKTIQKFSEALNVEPGELDNNLVINLGSDSIYKSEDGNYISVPTGSPQDQVLNLLQVLTDFEGKQWIDIGRTLAKYPENRKDHGSGLKPES